MRRILMIYAIPKGNSILRISFNRRLFDYNIQSHSGRYKKKSKGILTEYEKPTRSCVIFNEENLENVRNLCIELSIEAKFYEIKRLTD